MRPWLFIVHFLFMLKPNLCNAECRSCAFPDLDGLYARNHIIHVLHSNGPRQIIEMFKHDISKLHCKDYFEYHNMSSLIISDFLRNTNLHWRYFILLGVTDFYQTNLNDLNKHGWVFAGDIPHYKVTADVCKGTAHVNEKGFEVCEVTQEIRPKYSKLVNYDLANERETLYNFVKQFSGFEPTPVTDINDSRVIIVCGEDYVVDEEFKWKTLFTYSCIDNLSVKFQYNCPDVNMMAVKAILTPRPYEFSDGTSKTLTLFYDHHYLSQSTKDTFANSLTAFDLQSYLRAFIQFIEIMKWNRVAIVSDDSEDNIEFERLLTSAFEEKNILYVSESCMDVKCNIGKVIDSLAKPTIIIANIKEGYASTLTKYKLKGVTWLVRDWSTIATEALNEEVFSIRMGYAMDKEYHDIITKILPSKRSFCDKLAITKKTSTPLQFIATKLKYSNKALIGETIATEQKLQIQADVIQKSAGHRIVATMTLNGQKMFYPHLEQLHISSSTPSKHLCTFVRYNYDETCDDSEFVSLMIVICVFLVTLAGVLCFFSEPNLPYTRMRY